MLKSLLKDIPSNLAPIYQEETDQYVLSRVRVTCYLGIALFLLFNLLDRIIFPDLANLFLLLRLISASIHAGILGMTWTSFGRKHPILLGINAYVTIGWIIIVMCILSGGHRSPFYAGLNLVIVGYSLLMPWRIRHAVLTSALIYGGYIGAIFTTEEVKDWAIFANNNFFILCTITEAIAASFLWQVYRVNQFLDQQKLKELDQAKSKFFSNVSHELKTPMTLVITPLEYALDKAGENAQQILLSRKSFNAIRHSAYRLAGLISDLLDLTKGQIGKDRIRPAVIQDTEAFFRDIFQSLMPLMDEKKIQHEFFRSPKQLQPHLFDRVKLDKVVVNLLSNAIKFTPKGGKIAMRIWDEEKDGTAAPVLKVSVSDTGIGIPQEKILKVFERFVQVDDSSTRGYAGLGIGLSLVKDFVEQHGGTIDVESRVGFGTTMIITLPRGKEHFKVTVVEDEESDIGKGIELPTAPVTYMASEAGAPEEKEEIWPAEKGQETVLVVDDNADMRVTLKEILGEKFRVVTAEDGVEGLKVAKAERPDLIISDVMMPRRDGYGLIIDIRSDPALRKTPVILLTAKTGADNRADGLQHGADDYVEKPFHPKEIVFRVENLLKLTRQARSN